MNQTLKYLTLVSCTLPFDIAAETHPNIIYICTDQQTASAMSCMGNTDLDTPNFDRIAKNGILFTHAYCSSPLSGPSRASMFTGHYAHELGCSRNGTPLPSSYNQKEILGNKLASVGYESIYAGKWHVHTASMPTNNPFGFQVIAPVSDKGLAEAVVKYLEADHDKPFFLVVGYENPHNVCEYARQQNLPYGNINDIRLEDCPNLPANFAKNPYDADVIDFEKKQNYSAYPTQNYSPEDWRKYRYAYYRLVEKVDKEIGKIIDSVDRKNLWKNTIIIFSSDHGDGVGAHHWNQKSVLYEETTNVPMIVTLPGKKHAGKILPQIINNGIDFYATICEFAGVNPSKETHGISYKTLVENGDPTGNHQSYIIEETTFDRGAHSNGWCVHDNNFKYVLYDKGNHREQLFDIRKDSGEMCNLAIQSKYKDTLQKYRDILYDWQLKTKVPGVIPLEKRGRTIVPGK